MNETLLRVQDVCFEYEAAGPHVLSHVNLSVGAGQSVAVVGPSGCGKSTLLNIIGTLEKPTQGRVVLDGQDYSALDPDRLAVVRNRKIGFVFQDHHLLPQCTLLENVLLPTLPTRDADKAGVHKRAEELLHRVGLCDLMHRRPGEVSGGQRQRCAVVRALINRPVLLLADEPTGALDRASSEALGRLLLDINLEQGVALIVVTHATGLAEKMQSTHELRDGRLAEIHNPQPQA